MSTVAYLAAAALAALGIWWIVQGASPALTLAAGIGVGVLVMLARRIGGGPT
ncbi:MAG: hypothetical protein WD336_10015 [Trueperaceae bacterium]